MNPIPTQEQVSEWIRTTQLEPHGEGWSREQRFAELVAQWGASQTQQATPEGFVRVPLVMTQAMEEVTQQEDWQWADLLAAAEAVTEEQYNMVQAQQPPVEEPELPEAVAWQGRWLDQSDDAEGWSEWRAIDTIDLPRWQKRVTNKPGCYEIRALFTAAQWGAAQAQQAIAELPTGKSVSCKCSVCGEWQRSTESGMACKNGHGGVLGINVRTYTATQMHDHYQAGVRAGMARGQSLQALQRGFEKVLADPEKHGLDLGGQK